MPYRVIYTPEASDQLEAPFLYVAKRSSPETAERYTEAVLATCEGLGRFPARKGILSTGWDE